ncbi:MAG: DNA-directed RNA polymerase subunit delta [Mycoplasmatota bacterium]
MSLKKMTKEEIEILSYTDLTGLILKEEKKGLNTPSIFKKICELLSFSESDYAEKIGDYYTSLTLDKRFILLESGEWDLALNHKANIDLEELEEIEEIDEEEIEEIEEAEETEDDSEIEVNSDVDELDTEDDLGDLTIVEEDELEED